MLTDESLIEWAKSWVADVSPTGEAGNRERFATALREEVRLRREALVRAHCDLRWYADSTGQGSVALAENAAVGFDLEWERAHTLTATCPIDRCERGAVSVEEHGTKTTALKVGD